MNAYLNGIVVTVVACQIATVFSPNEESLRRYVRILCALVTVMTLVSPIKYVISGAEEIMSGITNFFEGSDFSQREEEDGNGVANLAYVIMSAVSNKFDIEEKDVRITIVTDEQGELSEIQMYLKRTAYVDRERILEALSAEFEIPVYVFAER